MVPVVALSKEWSQNYVLPAHVISASRLADQLQGRRPLRAKSAFRGALSAGSALDLVPKRTVMVYFVV